MAIRRLRVSLNPFDFVRLLENSKFQKSEPASVRVMTIHQSKGLEFDVVVLPELEGIFFQILRPPSPDPVLVEAPDGSVSGAERPDPAPCCPNALQKAFEDTIGSTGSEEPVRACMIRA